MRGQAVSAETSDIRIAPALRAVFNILQAWAIPVKDWGRLLGVSQPTVHRWKADPDAAERSHSADLLERLSYILGIYKALQILLPDARAADSWIRRPNAAPLFGGATPLQRILGGHVADLYEVRRWLDGQRGTA
ncbi:MbcA/ParS/Xre antitoxin family protein [Elongatibacter sediminis]|uniref:MbcA/ParS/Xre antitoxin family protein n=1 Tax=Elongatibacter sediminis TaxID=3119006 RepID=A0AAW9RI91_9GAMM